MSAPQLSIDSVSVSYGQRRAIRSVSFSLDGGVTGLLGPNGAGKSTLLRCVATAQRPDNGSVSIMGIEATDPRNCRSVRRALGYLPQSTGYYPGFTVAAFAEHIAVLKEVGRPARRTAEVNRVLTAVGLEDRSRDKVRSLSGGMRQRLALACTMIGNPPLLVLDEPTVGLDPGQRFKFRSLIAELGRSSAVLLSTHQTDDVASLCSRVIVLSDGVMLFDGSPKKLAHRADGSVWEGPDRADEAIEAWATGEGTYRNIGTPPPGATLVKPTIDDGYILLMAASGSTGSELQVGGHA